MPDRFGPSFLASLALLAASAPAVRAEDGVAGTWRGRYSCAQGETALVLILRPAPGGGQVTGLFHFGVSPGNPGVPEGCFAMAGSFDASTREVNLVAGRWLLRPDTYVTVDLQGRLDPGSMRLSGKVLGPWCTDFDLHRAGPAPAAIPMACRGEEILSAR